MFSQQSALAVIGADLPTARASNRRAEIAKCNPGDVLQIRREAGRRGGCRMVGVYSPRGIQIGYLVPQQAEQTAGLVAVARAIFQRPDTFGAVARINFDGRAPTLPQPKPKPRRDPPPQPPADEFCDIFPARAAG
ncbi:hypothetical protein [Sphingobium agri]|uniref:hypothetical protein n=1 Tax=Sphingobium TaxID=165695 RepID=UPI001FF68552|nr:hypothetical protein [Sphingobium agri]